MTYYEVALEILKTLNDNNYEAYIVGGFVRDKLLNIKSQDIDITTNAKIEDIYEIFNVSNDLEFKYGSIVIDYKGYSYEITKFRVDLEYLDNRHPTIEYTDEIDLDIQRRDFTVNALLMNKNEEIIDKVDAIRDIEHKLIKTINDPNIRFQEDSLRILRCFYLVSKLNFEIEKKTYLAIIDNAKLISNLSFTRIFLEINKIIQGKYMLKAFKLMFASNIIEYIPELKKGIQRILDSNIEVNDSLLFYSICFYFEEIPSYYNFSKVFKDKLEKIVMLSDVCKEGDYNKLILYSYGLDICLYANKVNIILGYNSNKEDEITNNYNSLPIKKTCDLAFKGQDIVKLTDKIEDLSIIGGIIDRIKFEILINELSNDYESIKKFVIENQLLLVGEMDAK